MMFCAGNPFANNNMDNIKYSIITEYPNGELSGNRLTVHLSNDYQLLLKRYKVIGHSVLGS
jgi:hypothetical protein